MKKTLAMLLALVMLFSLCACSNSDNQPTAPSNSSQATTDGAEGTTSATQSPTGEPTTAPTEEPTTAPTEQPTTQPTEAPTTSPTTPPTTCSHSYKDATCTAPKTCSKCGATEGNALGHSWNAATCTAPKTCSKCGTTEGNALGHTHQPVTCTAGATCTVCGAAIPAAEHKYTDATCTTPKTCSICGATEGSVLAHSYQNGTCTGCGAEEVITHPIETGTGYAITVSSNEVICYQITASELLYDQCTTEKPASGWYKFREHNGTAYYSPAPSWGWCSANSCTISGRTVQLELYEETLELELISANQYKVTKGTAFAPEGLVFTFGTDMCSFVGHLYERSCENDVTCMYCDHIKCAGLGHEYGEDGICFRCFSAERPSDSSDSE